MQSLPISGILTMTSVTDRLLELRDEKYRSFQSKLVPEIAPEAIIGVRVPDIKKLAKSLSESEKTGFLNALPHRFYDENMLHSALVSLIKDFDAAVFETDKFLEYIDNWAVCDTLNPKAFSKNHELLLSKINGWMASDKVYVARFGIGMLMRYFLDGDFDSRFLYQVAAIRSKEYYLYMMQAWFFATALSKQYDSAVKIIEERRLEPWTHNKAIQKARESFRVLEEHKEYLNTLRIKKEDF